MMKNLFKYMGIALVLLVSFYYTEKMSKIVVNNSSLVKEINKNIKEYNVASVSAIIEDEYIIPGLNGYAVNVLKSYNNMRYLDTFNSYYLEYDKITPDISLENNKDKIIKFGNPSKNNIALVIQDNQNIINYASSMDIKITRLVDSKTFDKNSIYEQINNDYENYSKVEAMLDNNNVNKNICFVSKNIKDVCLKNKKYLVEASVSLNSYNLASIKDSLKSGYVIFINDSVSLTDFKLLVKQINYQDLKINYLSELITEER